MNVILTAMFDRKSGYTAIQPYENEAIAKRAFGYAINDAGIPNYAPADFELYKVGEFDTKTGVIIPAAMPELLMSGLDCIGR